VVLLDVFLQHTDIGAYTRKEKDHQSGQFVCKTCGKSNKQKGVVKSHVEAIHFAGHFVYSCGICGKTFNGKNSLSTHMSVMHRGHNL
jgi:DNA-directed RNA polymerase subunit RPC12/RpoP